MQRIDGRLVFSASDLNDYLACEYLSALQRRAALGEMQRPEQSPSAALIAAKGIEHEQRYLAHVRDALAGGLVEFRDRPEPTVEGLERAQSETVTAMERGADVIYQATFFDGAFVGYADFLRKVPRPCANFAWSYEVLDTKLALTPKPYFLVQLCNYSEHLARIQGSAPEYAAIVPGSGIEQRFLLADFMAYYRGLKRRFLQYVASQTDGAYPHEVGHCQICRWSDACEAKRNADDYLGLVATMRRDAMRKLQSAGITTLAALGAATQAQRPQGMNARTFERLREQAELQHAQRTTGRYEYRLLPFEAGRGFALMPAPDPGDVFFDMEGDPLYTPEHGLEYLFGAYLPLEDRYVPLWGRDPAGERRAFEAFMDLLVERHRTHPGMHVYHYAPYETSALKRLCGRYGSREDDLDRLLRAQVFVDLYAIVRQGIRISQPSYSIKKLEPFYGFTRQTKTQRGDDSILMFESWLVSNDDAILADIERYNRDDCVSTLRLRDWLTQRRAELAATGVDLAWRAAPQRPEPEAEADDERAGVRDALLAGIEPPENAAALRALDDTTRMRWLLGHLLDYHRRDEKPAWWAYFHRCDNRDELVEFDREALGGLRHRDDIAPYSAGGRNLVHVYDYPEQLHAFAAGDAPYVLDAERPRGAGTIVNIDDEALQLHLKVSGTVDAATVDALTAKPAFDTKGLRAALLRVARAYRDGRLSREHRALEDVLLARAPRAQLNAGSLGAVALSLDESYLFVQGPPGSGKSTKGAAMVVDLLAAGKRVAILANAHKAIHNLLHKIESEAERRGVAFSGIQRYSNETQMYTSTLEHPYVTPHPSNDALTQEHNLAAGTAWVFSRDELVAQYDYLVIDEAGQVSLANAIACAPCARNIVLLGDPLQLAQVSQGAHPVGLEASILEHLLAGATTVPEQRGIFLDESYRMHPAICDFISEAVYGGRLHAAPETRDHAVDSAGLHGSGLRFLPVTHAGNTQESPEEADAIAREIALLVQGTYHLRAGAPQPLDPGAILVVSPYNAQRRLLRATLRDAGLERVRVGTVDAFQGQQAPVVFYSMATSSGDDVPRSLGFLFEKNRLNVAVSRAQCMSVVVCSPRLLEAHCSTPEQMSLVNLLCRFVEAATA